MLTRISLIPFGWTKTFVLAGIACFMHAPLSAEEPVIMHDASAVRIADLACEPIETNSEVSQVGYQGSSYSTSCETGCDSMYVEGCDGCGTTACCCDPWWAHRNSAFGQFLLLRPGNVDHIYTIEQNDTVPGAFPTGPVGRVNIDEEAGYRVGFNWAASDCASLQVAWTRFEGDTSDQITRSGTNVLNSQIIHPSTLTTGSASLQSAASYSLDFQLIDVAYRHILKRNDNYVVNWFAGFRFGNMDQDFLHQQQISTATGLVTVDTDVDFHGFGSMIGLDAERRVQDTPMFCYLRGLTSLLAGDWEGSYRQTNQFGGGVVANDYEDYRITPVLEFELGIGMQSECGTWRGTFGYVTTGWYDAISTRQYVDAVRAADYTSVGDTITFNGITAQIERRF